MGREMRTIITIDEEKCNGCGLCVTACHEGALALVNGKAVLTHEHYCDGLGDCLPACPQDAISFEERVAEAYDEEAVLAALSKAREAQPGAGAGAVSHGCPGSAARFFGDNEQASAQAAPSAAAGSAGAAASERPSQLRQWPVQIKLISPDAPYFDGADVLIAADCCAFAYAGFHEDYMAGKITLIGCPKLDAVDYAEKLGEILSKHDVNSVTVTRMQVPCCGGIEQASKTAIAASGKDIPLSVVTVTTDGHILS